MIYSSISPMFMQIIIHKCAEVTLVRQRYFEMALQMERIGKNDDMPSFKVTFKMCVCVYEREKERLAFKMQMSITRVDEGQFPK